MPEDEQHRLERFGRPHPPSFSGAEGEDTPGFLDRCQTILHTSDREMIRRFIDGLTYQLRLFMTREIVSGATIDEVVDIARQIEMVRSQERVKREAKRPRGQGGFSGTPSRVHSSSRAPSGQGSSMPGPSASYPGAQGSLQSPAQASGCCYECGKFGHMRRECPRLVGGPAPQRNQYMSSASVPPPPAQSARGRPRGRDRSGDGQACFYALPARPDAIAFNAVIIVSSVHVSPPMGDMIIVDRPGGACSASEDCVTEIDGGEALCKDLQV
ncbi:uncharacterized protein [Nicotiana tomentosiformis]|uniref:uncharacterized protein n=1 Tax=Nicotiana tomentosiformis TaxID=4098 RepID=UPI00388C791D